MITVAAGTREDMFATDTRLTTSGTGVRAISRVGTNNGNAFLQSLIFDKPLELGKRPRVMNVSLPFSDSCPFSDVGQLFHHNNIAFAEAIDNPAAYVVVEPADYSALLARKLFQELFSPFRALGLKSRPQSLKSPPYMHCLLPRESETIGGSGKIVDAEVNSYDLTVIPWHWPWDWDCKSDVDIERFLSPNKNCMSGLLSSEEMPLIVSNGKRNFNPALYGRKGNHLFWFDEAKNSLVIIYRCRFKPFEFIPLNLIGIGNPRHSSHSEISGKSKSLLKFVVASLLKLKLVCCPKFLGFLKDRIASVGESFKRSIKGFNLFRGGVQLAGNRLDNFHNDLIISLLKGSVKGAFLPPLKSVGFLVLTL